MFVDEVMVPSSRPETLQRAVDYIEACMDRPLSVEEIAADISVSASSLQRLFHDAHGCSMFGYIRDRKIGLALEALRQRQVNAAQAAYIAGCSNAANFAAAFRRKSGATPSQARVARPTGMGSVSLPPA